ncbi:MOSC domain-containing protein [Hydrogenibacillus schlegelii]|uniref:MOSC domain-containing protein n=1 Tax=Hydrogenibacillus schlegelii TaxID=1484 RepID=A0A947G8P7_HYDSH|nr:MOSC domain-containing protein [Hydrogenibacillus schlegelii]KWX06419.1 hypothetical protein TR75_06035 [Hydrogenibacillus schlegelii]MBT9282892.1 MOSC domain-containing protein [Hydrogenibacillus schlegelii]
MENRFRVRGPNVGPVRWLAWDGRGAWSAIDKRPVDGPLRLTRTGFVGDAQGDPVRHGGPDKAVSAYPLDHYAGWERWLGRPLPPAAFGENLTVEGLTEEAVGIGDVFRLGTALLQVAQPRRPCFKLELRYENRQLPAEVRRTGKSGWYFRVLEEGMVRPGDRLIRLERDPRGVSVAAVMAATDAEPPDPELLGRLADHPALADGYRRKLLGRLERREGGR